VIEAFGHFVIGGDTVVGLIVFLILNIINFVVITKGAGRISEVSARFTLDAMPGKQLAIDADLNAGIINDKAAKERREEIQREADFYGSMDGASKFVRGDAIAGILITFINIIGGLVIGIFRDGMDILQALNVYTIMTIGDGLVAQIPALIVSFAAGLIVTKVNKETDMQSQIVSQVFSAYRPLMIVSGMLLVITLVPGLPKLPFFAISMGMGIIAYRTWRRAKNEALQRAIAPKATAEDAAAQAGSDVPQTLDILEIEVGYDLVELVNNRNNNDFVKRILALRKQFAQEMGILVPPIHIQDNLLGNIPNR
jgi:flagellar biosynthesis protein FlhA